MQDREETEEDRLIFKIRMYAARLNKNIPDSRASKVVRDLIATFEKGDMFDLKTYVDGVARKLYDAGGPGANRLVAYDLKAMREGYEVPNSIGMYFTEAVAERYRREAIESYFTQGKTK